jgi:hypothetical protein
MLSSLKERVLSGIGRSNPTVAGEGYEDDEDVRGTFMVRSWIRKGLKGNGLEGLETE